MGLPQVVSARHQSNVLTSSKSENVAHQAAHADSEKAVQASHPSNGRVMLIDGTSVIYRAYYKLLGIIISWYFLKYVIGLLMLKFELLII